MLEAVTIAVMRGAGVNIEKLQEPVSLKIGDIELKGTYDVKIDGRVWDIKSASPASFLGKFGEYGSYNKIKEKIDVIITSPPYATALPYIDTDRLSLLAVLDHSSRKRKDVE